MSRRPAQVALDVQVCPAHAGSSPLIVIGGDVCREHAVSVADRLGLQDLEGELMCAARAAWRRWSATHQSLAVVPEFDDLRDWTRAAPVDEANAVLGALASMTETDGGAVTALVWALLPGAEARARKLRDLDGDIDGLFASQLWVECSSAHRLKDGRIAGAILGQTTREVCAHLGVGDLARRRDRFMVDARELLPGDDVAVVDEGGDIDPFWEVTRLMIEAIDAKALHVFDAWLLGELARIAAELDVAGRRGRSGLTTPAVVDELAATVHLSARAIRRRATTALDRWAEFLRVRDDPDAYPAWRAKHRDCAVTSAEEMQLVLNEDGPAEFFRTRDLPPDAWAPDVPPERRRSAGG